MTRRVVLIVLIFLTAAALAAEEPRTGIKAAGCFIPTVKGVVFGIGTFRGDIRIPMGMHEAGETARETAIRETREETGLEVTTGPLLRTLENGRVFLFLCTPVSPIKDYSLLAPIDTIEIARVIVLDPMTMLGHDGRRIDNPWRFADNQALMIELYSKYKQPK
jgi:8-oxo-dGTP pyrophosphatase MutT (NUDIX family)